jgi:DNA (cytosine-5)-methyltransferase 1
VSAYYNEIDPYAAQWLRNLIDAGHIAPGDVDERSIVDVKPDDLRGYTQCHFFAGIAGWSYALRLAGWPDDRPVWTGSCPCQPFSAAGKGKASGDERHLWPHWFELIRACRPPVIFGEQVEAAIGWGWLDLVYSDLEAEGYTVGASVLPACSVGAPHIRQRLWFMGHANGSASERRAGSVLGEEAPERGAWLTDGRVADGLADASEIGELADATNAGLSERGRGQGGQSRPQQQPERLCADGIPWSDLIWLPCTDGKQRPTQSGIFPLAHGIPARVAKLCAAGNAIVPQVAAEFIKASQ